MTQAELNELIYKHEQWLRGDKSGEQLIIGDREDVKGLDFSRRNLRAAFFIGTDLSFASFFGSNLKVARFISVTLNHTDFDKTDITYDEDLILRLAEDIKKSRQKKSPSDTSAQAASAEADKKGQ